MVFHNSMVTFHPQAEANHCLIFPSEWGMNKHCRSTRTKADLESNGQKFTMQSSHRAFQTTRVFGSHIYIVAPRQLAGSGQQWNFLAVFWDGRPLLHKTQMSRRQPLVCQKQNGWSGVVVCGGGLVVTSSIKALVCHLTYHAHFCAKPNLFAGGGRKLPKSLPKRLINIKLQMHICLRIPFMMTRHL